MEVLSVSEPHCRKTVKRCGMTREDLLRQRTKDENIEQQEQAIALARHCHTSASTAIIPRLLLLTWECLYITEIWQA